MGVDGQQQFASLEALIAAEEYESGDDLAETLTMMVDPYGVTGLVLEVFAYEGIWHLRAAGHAATELNWPLTMAWIEEAAVDIVTEALEQTAEQAHDMNPQAAPLILDGTVLEATSWRLASTLLRRHPDRLQLIRAQPSGGQADCLILLPQAGGPGDISLDRAGDIHVMARFDGRPMHSPLTHEWQEYLIGDHQRFVNHLEDAAGLPAPPHTPPATPVTLTARVLAALAATGFKSTRHAWIESGFIDTSGGMGPSPNTQAFAAFTSIDPDLTRPQPGDFCEQPGYRFWFWTNHNGPLLAFEQSQGLVWDRQNHQPIDLTRLHNRCGRDITLTSAELMRRSRAPRRPQRTAS